ncbi:MAG: KpsF/GutQ family sugar-phosphate isomerase [Acidobacteria bacterium]|nr:KpsF/GutQ family sugar-phosphate isomerase [Acidobacteriota bacterium]
MSIEVAKQVLRSEAEAIRELIDRLDGRFERAVELLSACRGRVVTTGIGKSGIICQKIAATLSSTGTAAHYLHPTDALHGDLGVLRAEDLLLVVSNSGETEEILRLLPLAKRMGTGVIALCGGLETNLARFADVAIDVGIGEEACPLGLAPTASTTAALAMGDALAMAVLVRRGFTEEDFASLHPAGALGRKLTRVRDLMHTGDRIPMVGMQTGMKEVIREMSAKGFGLTAVTDGDGRLEGVISDGDLRRLVEREGPRGLESAAGDVMSRNPRTIGGNELATAALRVLEAHHITSLLIVDEGRRLEGIVHLHDLWRTEMI